MAITGDASGGALVIRITMDPRFTTLVGYASFLNIQVSSADADFHLHIGSALNRTPDQSDSGVVTAISATIDTKTITKTWFPAPILLAGGRVAPFIELRMLNVTSDVVNLSLLAYVFDIRARELTPMGPLLWARGTATG